MNFEEIVPIQSFINKTGKLHFLSDLINYIFGISRANNNKEYIFNLPEGHWPGGKSANEV